MPIIVDIPEIYIDALRLLSSFDQADFNILIDKINSSPMVFRTEQIAEKINDYSLEEIKSILVTMASLFGVRDRKETTAIEVADDVIKILKKKELKDFDFNQERENNLKARIQLLLDNENLYLSSKPINILGEFENIYLSSKIITDIRPIFGTDITIDPKAGMIIHNLHIHYKHGDEGDNHEDIFFALDNHDLTELKRIIERSEKKSKALKGMLEKNSIKYLEPRDN